MEDKLIYTFNARDCLIYPLIKKIDELSDLEVYNSISVDYKLFLKRLEKKKIVYKDLKGALIPNQEVDKYETCFVIDTAQMDSSFYGYHVFEKLIPLLDKNSTYSILCGDYIDLNVKDNRLQVLLKEILNEGLVKCNESEFKHSNQYFLIYFNRLTVNQRKTIIDGLTQYSWFTGFVDVSHYSRFKSYIAGFLVQAYVKCHRHIIAAHPSDCDDEENINMMGYPFEKYGYSFVSINEESFGMFLSYKIEAQIPDKTDVGFSFNALFPKFLSMDKIELMVNDVKWSDYLVNEDVGKGKILKAIGYNMEEKERFLREVYKKISKNYIYNLRYEHNVLLFNVCIEFPTNAGNFRRTTIGLKYDPEMGSIYIVTVT